MPVYEYECTSCGQTFEKLQSVSARAPRTCPYCQKSGTVRRRVSAPAFQFKGSGWYVTDYAGKGKGVGKKSESGAESSGDDQPAKTDDKGDKDKDREKDREKDKDKKDQKDRKDKKAEPKATKSGGKGDD